MAGLHPMHTSSGKRRFDRHHLPFPIDLPDAGRRVRIWSL